MSKLSVIKKIRIKTPNSTRIVIPQAFVLRNDIKIGDELLVFIADSDELVIRKIKKSKEK